MKTISDIIGLDERRKQDGLWGVEIEVEGDNLPARLPEVFWRVEQDGSLEAGRSYEYVMPKPLSIEGVNQSLIALAQNFKLTNAKIDESVRAGVHVHMNVQKLSVKQLFTFITCYFILEELLVKWCGENREGNLFCLRSQDAEEILFNLVQAVEKRNLKNLNTDEIRYCSLNLLALFKYGSVEFRSMRSTGDLRLIMEWVEILNELRENALEFNDPQDVVLSMSGGGEEWFIAKLLPTKWHQFKQWDIGKSIRSACRRVQMVAFATDWNELDKPNNNPFIQVEGW